MSDNKNDIVFSKRQIIVMYVGGISLILICIISYVLFIKNEQQIMKQSPVFLQMRPFFIIPSVLIILIMITNLVLLYIYRNKNHKQSIF